MGNKVRVFVYGTLLDPEIQKGVLGRVTGRSPDTLEGYKISEIEIEGETYPLVVPSGHGGVRGAVIEVECDEMEKIDEYETDAYQRKKVGLKSGTVAWVYLER